MKAPSQYFIEGMDARAAGHPRNSCKLAYNAWPSTAWFMGWDYANLVRQIPRDMQDEGDLKPIIKTPFEQGICHYYEGRKIDDGPYQETSPDGIAWAAGYIFAEEGDSDEPVTDCSLSRRAWWLIIGGALGVFWLLAVWAII